MNRILELLKKERVTVADIARDLGVSRTTIYEWDKRDDEHHYKIIASTLNVNEPGEEYNTGENKKILELKAKLFDNAEEINKLEKMCKAYEDEIGQLRKLLKESAIKKGKKQNKEKKHDTISRHNY